MTPCQLQLINCHPMPNSMFFYLFLLILNNVSGEWKCIVVVEYHAIDNPNFTPEERLNANADEYIKILDNISKNQNVIIIVFPEATLDNVKSEEDFESYGVTLRQFEQPCALHKNNYPPYLQRLSCAAKKYDTAIVFNLIQIHDSEFCSSDVVLNHNGVIQFSIPRENRIGVKDLHTFPIAFAIPATRAFYYAERISPVLVIVFGFTPTSFLTGFSFSANKIISLSRYRYYLVCSNWISQLPFLTSLQVHQMWAQEFNISVFFSSANDPQRGQGGTGVYHAIDGPVLMDIVTNGRTKAYVYNFSNRTIEPRQFTDPVPEKNIDDLSKEMDGFYLERDPDLYRYESSIISPDRSEITETVCYNGTENNYFCCHFSLQLSFNSTNDAKKQYIYHMVAYKGYKTYYDIFEPGGVEVCAIIACLNSSISSCGQRFDKYEEIEWPLTFEGIVVKARFKLPLEDKIFVHSQFPNSLLSSIRPIHPDYTQWNAKNITDSYNTSYIERTFILNYTQNRILTFGIFGRNFTLVDPRPTTNRNTRILYLDFLLLVISFSISLLIPTKYF